MSQNCLLTCNFDFQFVFCYTGWEGSATDVQVLDAVIQAGFEIPDGYYYLSNAGYLPTSKNVLTPYHGVWYHLAE